MKIIKKGLSDVEVERLNRKPRQFTCEVCGCVFEADNTEYKHNYDQYEGDEWWTYDCPNCGRLVMDSIEAR